MTSEDELQRLRDRVATLEGELAAVREREEQFRTIADCIPQLAWIATADGWVFWYNRRWYEYTGTTLADMKGWGWRKVQHPDYVDSVAQGFAAAAAAGLAWEDTFPLRCRDGTWRWFLSRAMPIRDASGAVVRWFGTNTDITEQLEAEREGERNRALVDALFENAPVGLCFSDLDLRYTRLNQALAEMNGMPIEAHIGKTPEELLDELGRGITPMFRSVIESGAVQRNIEFSGTTPARPGAVRTWLASLYPVRLRGEISGLGSVIIEITDRKQAEEELARVSERLQWHLDNTPAAIIEFDSDFRITRWSREAERLLGWTAAEVLGRKIFEFPLVHEDDIASVESMFRAMSDAQKSRYFSNNRNRRKDGSVVTVDWYNSVLRDADGRALSILSFGVDVTARKEAEDALHGHAEALARSNAELQQFAYAASHDLQEPMRMVALYTQLLRRKYGGRLDADADLYIDYANQGARRMQDLLRDLLLYARLASTDEEHAAGLIDMDAVLRKVLFVLEQLVRDTNATVVRSALPHVRIQEVHALQLLQNLLSNALKYARPGIPPEVHVSATKKNQEWLFAVRDNGMGIAPEYQEQVFGLFKRLHAKAYPGTGIGLSISQRIVQRYGGAIWLESEGEGKGSTFYFTLPAA